MSFLTKLFPSLAKKGTGSQQGYTRRDGQHAIWIYFQCGRCGEKIPVRIRTTSELQRREGPDADLGPGHYFIRKTVVGSQCFQRIEAVVDFDHRYNVVESHVQGGRLIPYTAFYEKDEH